MTEKGKTSPEVLAKLRRNFVENFSDNELRDLCFDLGVDDENFPREKADKARELIRYLEYRDRIPELVEKCRELRTNVSWPDVSSIPPQYAAGESIASSPPPKVVKPVDLPPELLQAVESPLVRVRAGAVEELNHLLHSNEPSLFLAAQQALVRLANDDSRAVSATASKYLADYAQSGLSKSVEPQPRLTRSIDTPFTTPVRTELSEPLPCATMSPPPPVSESLTFKPMTWLFWLDWFGAFSVGFVLFFIVVEVGIVLGRLSQSTIIASSAMVGVLVVSILQWQIMREYISQGRWWMVAGVVSSGLLGFSAIMGNGGPDDYLTILVWRAILVWSAANLILGPVLIWKLRRPVA